MIFGGRTLSTTPITRHNLRRTSAPLEKRGSQGGNNNNGDNLDILRQARQMAKQAQQKASRMQSHTTQQLLQRIKDLKYWTNEIDREIHDLIEDTDELVLYRNRLNKALEVTSEASKINQDSISARQKRIVEATGSWGTDKADAEFKKESKITLDILKTMKDTLLEAGKQVDRNNTIRLKLQRDLMMKKEALNLDTKSVSLINGESQLQTPVESGISSGRSTPATSTTPAEQQNEKMTPPQEWIEATTASLNASAKERVRSRKQVHAIITLLKNSSNHLKAQSQQVDATLKDTIKSLGENRQTSITQIKTREKEIHQTQQAVSELRAALKEKQKPLQVAQNRFDERKKRPGLEQCQDKAHQALVTELTVLKDSINILQSQLDKAKETKEKLEEERERLLSKQEVCEHNIRLDSDILRKIRSKFPQEIQLAGFLFTEVKQQKSVIYED